MFGRYPLLSGPLPVHVLRNFNKYQVDFSHFSRMAAGLGATSANKDRSPPIPLEATTSPFVDKLKVNHDAASASALSVRGGETGSAGGGTPRLAIRPSRDGTVFVGTIRMGFGHHRIAYSASSWGLDAGMSTYFHDLLNIKSREAGIISKADG